MDILAAIDSAKTEVNALKANKRINFEQLSYKQKNTSFIIDADNYYTVHAVCTPSTTGLMPVVDYSIPYIDNVYPESAIWHLTDGKPDLELVITAIGATRTVPLTICGFNLEDVAFSVSKRG